MSNLVSSVDTNAFYVPPAPKAPVGLNMATFLHLLTVQMASQNPLEPMKDSDLYAQISQLGQVQGNENLQRQGEFNKAQSLVGKSVDAVNPSASSLGDQIISGRVTGVTISPEGTVKLKVQQADGTESSVAPGAVQQVYETPDTSNSPIPADYAFIIGKHVGGLNGKANIDGLATGIAVSKGVIMVDVVNNAGVKLQIPVGGITSIS